MIMVVCAVLDAAPSNLNSVCSGNECPGMAMQENDAFEMLQTKVNLRAQPAAGLQHGGATGAASSWEAKKTTTTASAAAVIRALFPASYFKDNETLEDFHNSLDEDPELAESLLEIARKAVRKEWEGVLEDEDSQDEQHEEGDQDPQIDPEHGDSAEVAGLDPEHAEKLLELESRVRVEKLAEVVAEEGEGDLLEDQQLRNDLIDGKKGPEVMQEVIDVADAASDIEPADSLVKMGIEFREQDLTRLESYELDKQGEIVDQEVAGEDHEEDKNVESGRALLSKKSSQKGTFTDPGTGGTPWPLVNGKATIGYCFLNGINDKSKKAFQRATDELWRQCNTLDFEYLGETTTEACPGNTAAIVVGDRGEGCYSNVGYGGAGQARRLNLHSGSFWSDVFTGTCATTAIAMHEILHSLGHWHEHSRSDRDNHVEVYMSNVKDGMGDNFNMNSAGSNQESYDYGSLMHYSCGAFAKSSSKDTIRATNRRRWWDGRFGRKDCSEMGQRSGMSSEDITQLRRMYSCTAPDTGRRRRFVGRRRRWVR